MPAQTWFITGASHGLGRIMAEQLLNHGDRVAGTGRDGTALAELSAGYRQTFWPALLDVTDTNSAGKFGIEVAAAVIAVARQEPAPLRVVLGSDSYAFVLQALTDRLEGIRGQQDTASAVDTGWCAEATTSGQPRGIRCRPVTAESFR